MKLALITGQGDIPRLIAEHRRDAGEPPFIIALKGFEGDWIRNFEHDVSGIAEFGKTFKTLRAQGCDTISFIGNVKRPDFSKLKPDLKGMSLLPKMVAAARKGDDALLRAIVKAFEDEGFAVVGAHDLLNDLSQTAGRLNTVSIDDTALDDIALAYEVAGEIGRLDIGQGCVVCNGLVLAVEAQEGTDEMLKRVGKLPENIRGSESDRKGVLLKRPKPIQEQRVDMPTLGPSTVRLADDAGLKVIAAIEGGALWVELEEMRRLADAAGIALVSLSKEGRLL